MILFLEKTPEYIIQSSISEDFIFDKTSDFIIQSSIADDVFLPRPGPPWYPPASLPVAIFAGGFRRRVILRHLHRHQHHHHRPTLSKVSWAEGKIYIWGSLTGPIIYYFSD